VNQLNIVKVRVSRQEIDKAVEGKEFIAISVHTGVINQCFEMELDFSQVIGVHYGANGIVDSLICQIKKSGAYNVPAILSYDPSCITELKGDK
jgi:hypothetical protein